MDPKTPDTKSKLGRSATMGRLSQKSTPKLRRSSTIATSAAPKLSVVPKKPLGLGGSALPARTSPKRGRSSKKSSTVPKKPLGLGGSALPARPAKKRPSTLPAKSGPKLGRSSTLPARPATPPKLGRLASMPARPKPVDISAATGPKKNKFAETLKGSKPINVEGGVPLFALLNSEEHGNKNYRMRVPKYNLFKEGELITDPRYIRELTEAEKKQLAARPPVCVGEKLVLSDPNSCYVRGMESRLKATYDEVAKYRGTSGNNPFCDVSNPKPQTHQQAIFELARTMATRTPEELSGSRGLLCWHSTGSGKTVTSLGIVLAFWDSPRNIVLATTPDNAGDNNLSKYSANLFKMFPDYVGKVFPNAPPGLKAPWTPEKTAALDAWCKDPNNIKPMTNRVRTYTFTTLASSLCLPKEGALGQTNPIGPTLLMGKYGGKCGEATSNQPKGAGGKIGSVLIMDEVQSLFTPDPKFARAAKFLAKELVQEKYRKHMFVFALTATPGNNVDNMLDVLNFVRPLGVPVLTANDIKSNPAKFRGLVSYADIRGDTSRYGIKTVKNIYVPMSDKYYVGFLRAIGKLTADNLNYSKAERASKELGFLSKQKAAGNSLAKTSLTGLYTEAELKEFTTAKGSGGVIRAVDIGRGQLRLLSDKLRAALSNAMSMPGKQYLYISDGTTNKVVIAMLGKMGYAAITSKDYVKQGKKYVEGPRLATKAPRFIMYRTGAVTAASGAKETLDENILKAYSGTFGARKNDDGGYAKIIIASGTFYQGFDTRALQGVHLIDPLFNVAADKQAVGRGLRLCGHSGAPSNKVTVYRYFSVPPPKFDIQTVANGMKGAASKRLMELDTLAQEVSRLSSPANTKNVEGVNGPVPMGVNTFIFKDAIRRNAPVDFFERLLKAQAVDCKLFKPIFHANEPFQCGVVPSGSLEIPPFSPAKIISNAKQAAKANVQNIKKPLSNYRVSAEASKKLNELAAKQGVRPAAERQGVFGGLFGRTSSSKATASSTGYAKGGYARGGYSSSAPSVFSKPPRVLENKQVKKSKKASSKTPPTRPSGPPPLSKPSSGPSTRPSSGPPTRPSSGPPTRPSGPPPLSRPSSGPPTRPSGPPPLSRPSSGPPTRPSGPPPRTENNAAKMKKSEQAKKRRTTFSRKLKRPAAKVPKRRFGVFARRRAT